MSTKAKPKSEAPSLLDLGDDELRAERAKAEQGVASVERKLAEVAEQIAAALGESTPDGERVAGLTAGRARLSREREKALARVAEVEQMVATAAARRAARESMQRRIVEYQQLLDEEAAGRRVLAEAFAMLTKAADAMPWKIVEKHPMGMRAWKLREEIEWDAREAGLEPPQLPPEPSQFAEAREFRVLGNLLSGTANAETGMLSHVFPLDPRAKAAQLKKLEQNPYIGGNGGEAVMRH